VASLDSVFSIVGVVIPMSLDLYADICNCGEGDDTVYVDELDVVNADCENVFETVEQV
jgi:hypothetical protein